MINFFSIMIHITTIIALAVTAIFYGGIFFNNQSITSEDTFNNCSTQLKICKSTSLVFVALYWFFVSGLPQKVCLEGYDALSKICSRFGCIWIIFAVINIILSIVISITKKNSEVITIMEKLRSSCFGMGALFLVVSFVLKVG